MTRISLRAYAIFWAGTTGPMILLVAILTTFGYGCGQSTPNQPDDARPLFPASIGATWEFISNRGKAVIASRFESVQPFSEGLAAAKFEGNPMMHKFQVGQSVALIPRVIRQAALAFEGVLEEAPVGVDRMGPIAAVLHHLQPVAGQLMGDDLAKSILTYEQVPAR